MLVISCWFVFVDVFGALAFTDCKGTENLIKEAVLSPIYFVFLQVLYASNVDKYNNKI